jgi:hypothetical protein
MIDFLYYEYDILISKSTILRALKKHKISRKMVSNLLLNLNKRRNCWPLVTMNGKREKSGTQRWMEASSYTMETWATRIHWWIFGLTDFETLEARLFPRQVVAIMANSSCWTRSSCKRALSTAWNCLLEGGGGCFLLGSIRGRRWHADSLSNAFLRSGTRLRRGLYIVEIPRGWGTRLTPPLGG